MASELEAQTKICEEGYAGYQEDIDQCSAKVQIMCDDISPEQSVLSVSSQARRAICYRYEALSQICDESQREQQNSFDGTKYFNSAYLLKSCTEDSRTVLPRHTTFDVVYCASNTMLQKKICEIS